MDAGSLGDSYRRGIADEFSGVLSVARPPEARDHESLDSGNFGPCGVPPPGPYPEGCGILLEAWAGISWFGPRCPPPGRGRARVYYPIFGFVLW